MELTNAVLLSAVLGHLTQAVTMAALWWLYRHTGLLPVLYNLLWRGFSLVWGVLGGYLTKETMLDVPGRAAPQVNVYVWAASALVNVIGTALFVWMLLALARRGRPLGGAAVSPPQGVA